MAQNGFRFIILVVLAKLSRPMLYTDACKPDPNHSLASHLSRVALLQWAAVVVCNHFPGMPVIGRVSGHFHVEGMPYGSSAQA